MSAPAARLTARVLGRRALLVAAGALLSGSALVGGAAAGGTGVHVAAAAPPTGAVGAVTAVAYVPPVPGALQVVRGFDPPATPYGAGHLGVDLRVPPGPGLIVAAGAGVVRFAGMVAGRGVVVVAHADGITTEYEPVQPAVRAGRPVQRGQPIGRLAGRHPGCPGRCLHWGARRGADYVDPLDLLRPLGPVALLPWRAPP